jgi:hypothetical protein
MASTSSAIMFFCDESPHRSLCIRLSGHAASVLHPLILFLRALQPGEENGMIKVVMGLGGISSRFQHQHALPCGSLSMVSAI